MCVFVTVFYFPTVFIDCSPQIPAEETIKKVEGMSQYDLSTILFYASFISGSDNLHMLSYSTLRCMPNRMFNFTLHVQITF